MIKRLTALFLCLTLLCSAAVLTVSANGISDATLANNAPQITVQATDGATVTFLNAARLPYTALYGTQDGAEKPADEQAFDASLSDALQNGTGKLSTVSSTGVPYQVFETDVSGVKGDRVVLSLDAATVSGERLALKAYNYKTAKWDTLGTAVTEGKISAEVPLADYAKDGKLRAMAAMDLVNNGSNRILWSTDPQHYVKFNDLNSMYEGIHNYMVSEYAENRLAYVVTTGDIVDDVPNMGGAKGQWKTADKMYKILDDAGVPYGIVSGNHDTGTFPAIKYTYYDQYFNAERYAGLPWFGGTEDDNRSHYDLVTVGNVDLLFMYIGYGEESKPETIAWANKVLDQYPHRNAVICTHQYLSSRKSEWAGRAEVIFYEIINKHDNVKMVLCGHDDGATRITHTTDSGNVVHEVLSDYQFVQVESNEFYADAPDATHSINGFPDCNGEGYLRSIDIVGNRVTMDTFSPVTGGKRPYGVRDYFSLDVDFIPANRTITTNSFTAAAPLDTLDTVSLSGSGTATCSKTVGATDTWIAKVAFADGSQCTEAMTGAGAAAGATTTVYADRAALQALYDTANTLGGSYVQETKDAVTAACSAASAALAGNDAEAVTAAYRSLAIAMGELTETPAPAMNRDYLTEVHRFDLAPKSWKNSTGSKTIDHKNSFITPTVTETGGLQIVASKKAPNGYPQMTYVQPIQFTPKDGKVYLYLDAVSTNGWSLYPSVQQNDKVYETRWNYIVEELKNKEWDAGNGTYSGVYDVTQDLIDIGLDLTQPMILKMRINTVPGPFTLNELALLTGEYAEPAPTAAPESPQPSPLDTMWPWLVIGGVVLIGAIIIVVVLLTGKNKKTADKKAEAADTPADTADQTSDGSADSDAPADGDSPADTE